MSSDFVVLGPGGRKAENQVVVRIEWRSRGASLWRWQRTAMIVTDPPQEAVRNLARYLARYLGIDTLEP